MTIVVPAKHHEEIWHQVNASPVVRDRTMADHGEVMTIEFVTDAIEQVITSALIDICRATVVSTPI
ncbi:hypothetical protein [Marmoricola endophyticus]|uniref:hypothetical protein n=1 Tax=Marmoricola endophyticus TaxID=2040280 RepID=UPI00166A486D|nr:hypothetical protein [Marmoricola endophyticus]